MTLTTDFAKSFSMTYILNFRFYICKQFSEMALYFESVPVLEFPWGKCTVRGGKILMKEQQV